MSKKVQISSDDSTYYDLPGSQGAFNSEAEAVDDTILGQTFSSNDIGLTQWSVSADGIFKGFSGYLAELKQKGTSTSMTGEAMSQESGQIYAIDAAAKEIWDRSQTLTVKDNGSAVSAADIEDVDYLFGRVTFASGYSVTGPITVDGNYYPTAVLGCANTYTLTMSTDAIDNTCFNTAQANSGRRTFEAGLRTVSLELQGVWQASANMKDELLNRNEIIVEVDPAGDGSSVARGFFKLSNVGQSGAVGALEEETLTFNLTVPDETSNPQVETPFNWRHTNTTLNQAIQLLLTSWLTELNTYYVRYLPTGVTGQSPLDGIKGQFVATDISLSGGLSNMNVFQAELQGTDAYTEV